MIILTGDLDMVEIEEKEESLLRQFERNNYFYGKLMTVSDFELEQEYFNGKRYLLNRLFHGKGLLSGLSDLELSVESSDEVSIWFRDGGVALDCLGREIIVPVDTKKKILTQERKPLKKSEFRNPTFLYLRYSSAVSQPVKAVSSPLSCEEVVCANRILEDFDVIASFEPDVKNESGYVSFTDCEESEKNVFFAITKTVNKDLFIDKESSYVPYYLKTKSVEAETNILSATGVVSFKQPTVNSITSDFIDHKLGEGPISIQLGLEKEDDQILTGFASDKGENGFPKLKLGTILDRKEGKFKVQVVFEDERERSPINIRWWAYRAGMNYGTVEVKSEAILTKYKFASDTTVAAKIVENGLCKTGAKNCMSDGKISGGDHYAKVESYVALNGNPKKLAELIKEQDEVPKSLNSNWDVGGGWRLEVNNFDNTLKLPKANISLRYEKQEPKSFNVSKGDLITYCEDLEGETGAPLFVTYIDEIYIPGIKSLIGREARVTIKYTWAISKNIRDQDKKAEK
jgi:hypothetical protein